MEYEIYEPDPEDEYYDEMCAAAYARMFNERSDIHEDYDSYPQPVFSCASAG